LRIPKKDCYVSTFLIEIKKTVDNLVVVGCPISTEDHIEAILDGLSDEYDPFIPSIMSRHDPYMVEDIESLLLAREGRIEKAKHYIDHILQANVSYVPASFFQSHSTRTKPFSSNPTFGNGKHRFYSKPFFQTPRTISRCPPLPYLHGCNVKFAGNMGTLLSIVGTCLIPHFLLRLLLTHIVFSPLGTLASLHDPLWYPDSGAFHHLTAHNTNLSTKTPYIGSEKVVIGNGSRLPITFIGIATYIDLTTHNTFSLKNLLHVPTISKNLLSSFRFAHDNHVFFEFHVDTCLVKPQET